MLIVMQRVHENDLAGHVLRHGGYEQCGGKVIMSPLSKVEMSS
jgi:hypothetical protein